MVEQINRWLHRCASLDSRSLTVHRTLSTLRIQAGSLRPVYGLAEAALAVTFPPRGSGFCGKCFDFAALGESVAVPVENGTALVSVGCALPGYQVTIVDPEGRSLPERCIGEIVVRGRKYSPNLIEAAVHEVQGMGATGVAAVSCLLPGEHRETILVFIEGRASDARIHQTGFVNALLQKVLERTLLGVDRVLLVRPGMLPRTTGGKIRRGETLRRYLFGNGADNLQFQALCSIEPDRS